MTGIARYGTRISDTPLRFTFDGREHSGLYGDTAASALLANGMRVFGRSVKYRRPRGVLTAGPEEPNALLTWGGDGAQVPNAPAPVLQLHDGICLRSQNRWPTLRHDLTAAIGLGGRLFGAGFYYKTFMWPSWRTYEWSIRRLAGLGPAPAHCALAPPVIEHVDCDVVVAGAGPAGLAAALAAISQGARVVVCEREPAGGGELEFEDAVIDGLPARTWVAETLERLTKAGARILLGTAVVGESGGLVYAHSEASPVELRARSFRIRAHTLVIATGANERPIAFVDNDRPGVMLVGAAERYAARYGVRVGERVALFGNNDRLYAAARRLLAVGTRVVAIVDTRMDHAPMADLVATGVECLPGHAVLQAHGRLALRGVRVASLTRPTDKRDLECDALLVSGGWTPAALAGASSVNRIASGAANDILEIGAVMVDGHQAGLRAARIAVGLGGSIDMVARGDPAPAVAPYFRSPANRSDEKRQFVDFQNDVTVADLRQAVAEGFSNIEHAKRYTTLGIGTDQGRSSGNLGAAIIAELLQAEVAYVRMSRARPPYQPAMLSTLAGHRQGLALRPERRTPMHEWHEANGAVLESMGLWLRPRYYRANGADAASAGVREAVQVRNHGGIVDGSTLGKIEIVGADAGAFLDRVYLTAATTMRVGRSKYMVMLREDGMVLDDGIVLRVAADRFIATVSSGHAESVLAHLEFYRQLEFSTADVSLTDVTEAWAVIVVAGPGIRDPLLAVFGPDWHEVLRRLPHMELHGGLWRGAALRVLRASFSGELAYELHCKPRVALLLWQELVASGLRPYGLEALDILRLEKGYLVGAEMNGQTSPYDLGLEAMVKQANACIGRELLDRPGMHEPGRERLVGLQVLDPDEPLAAGAQLTHVTESRHACGHVTSAAYSPVLDRAIALGLVARSVPLGSELVARDPLRSREARVRVVPAAQYDPTGERMKS